MHGETEGERRDIRPSSDDDTAPKEQAMRSLLPHLRTSHEYTSEVVVWALIKDDLLFFEFSSAG